MRYLISNNNDHLLYQTSGKFQQAKNFKHDKRCIDTFVIFICLKGPIYIKQDSYKYALKDNQYLILFADHEHSGYLESNAPVSYYWCHFKIANSDYHIINRSELQNMAANKPENRISGYYVLPEYGDLTNNTRAILIFRQLLDISRGNHYSENLPNYALSLLAMEVSQEFLEQNFAIIRATKVNPNMEKIIEWIRINYNRHLTLVSISKIFSYTPNYLSSAFRKYKGRSLMKYILFVRLEEAKKLLLVSSDGIKEIAWKTGFGDERVFMKRFKQFEDLTPTQYRNTFSRVKLVKQEKRKS